MPRCYLMVEDTPEGGLVWAADYGVGDAVLDEDDMTDAQYTVFQCVATMKKIQERDMAPRIVAPIPSPTIIVPPGRVN